MVFRRRARSLLLAAAVLAAWPRAARAVETEGERRAPAATALEQEYIGIDLTPVSIRLTDLPRSDTGAAPPRVQTGRGAAVRFGRHRWEYTYAIPFQLAIYAATGGTGNDTVAVRVEVEGGFIVPGTDRRLEIGLAVGAGVLALDYSVRCDGPCSKGGAGPLASPVVRFLFREGPSVTIGASVRAIVPLVPDRDACFSGCSGFGSILLGGLEFGFGRGARTPGS